MTHPSFGKGLVKNSVDLQAVAERVLEVHQDTPGVPRYQIVKAHIQP